MNLLDKQITKSTIFNAKNQIEISDDSRVMYNTNSQVKLKTTILNAYIIIKGSVTVTSIAAADACANNTNKKITFKFCAPFNDGIRELNKR